MNRNTIAKTGMVPGNTSLITDIYPMQVKKMERVMREGAGTSKPVMKITGVFQKADVKNENGRIYPREVLASAVQQLQEDVTHRRVMGEFDHPQDAKIHLANVSHLITKVWMEGKYIYGEAEVLEEMPCGKMLGALLRSGVQVGISSRGVGDMETVMEGQEECYKVCDGYSIVTWDIVAEPSVQEAVMSVMESRNRRRQQKKTPADNIVRELNNWLKGR